eukprot:125981-Chlamydomonas_euryale.AAC.2
MPQTDASDACIRPTAMPFTLGVPRHAHAPKSGALCIRPTAMSFPLNGPRHASRTKVERREHETDGDAGLQAVLRARQPAVRKHEPVAHNVDAKPQQQRAVVEIGAVLPGKKSGGACMCTNARASALDAGPRQQCAVLEVGAVLPGGKRGGACMSMNAHAWALDAGPWQQRAVVEVEAVLPGGRERGPNTLNTHPHLDQRHRHHHQQQLQCCNHDTVEPVEHPGASREDGLREVEASRVPSAQQGGDHVGSADHLTQVP